MMQDKIRDVGATASRERCIVESKLDAEWRRVAHAYVLKNPFEEDVLVGLGVFSPVPLHGSEIADPLFHGSLLVNRFEDEGGKGDAVSRRFQRAGPCFGVPMMRRRTPHRANE